MSSQSHSQKTCTYTWDNCELKPIVFIHAKEEVLGVRAMKRLRESARAYDPTTERTVVDASTYETGELAIYASPSLFGERRFIEIPHLEKMNDALLNDLMGYITSAESSAWLVMQHNGGQRGRKLLDAIQRLGICTVQCPEVKRERDKINLVKNDVKRAQRRINNDAAQALVDALGSDLNELVASVNQLINDTQGVITKEVVRTYHGGKIEAAYYEVADATIAGDQARALTLLRHACETGGNLPLILAALATRLRNIAKFAGAPSRGGPNAVGLNSFQTRQARDAQRYWSESGLAYAITAVAHADVQVKGKSRDPQAAVEQAIIRVCRCRGR
ncbi:MAG: DNA polymerase III subunit delta [Actinomycetaceae bacterium]|nr:DNA polymerase III subunit delta [Actinomycetaceae bacterium]